MKRTDSASSVTASGQPAKSRHRLLRLFAVVLALYGAGFALFVGMLPRPHPDEAAKADAIVALTGEAGRLAPALALLESGHGQRLLITGVNRLLNKQRLKTLVHGGDSFDCCTDLGFAALDTRGNAAEAARWTHAHRYQSLIVVTADYHMPRSLLEFSAQLPDVKLIPFPVAGPGASLWQNVRRLNGEYAKFLASLVRLSVSGPPARA